MDANNVYFLLGVSISVALVCLIIVMGINGRFSRNSRH